MEVYEVALRKGLRSPFKTKDELVSAAADTSASDRPMPIEQDGLERRIREEDPDLVGSESFGLRINFGQFSGESVVALSAMGVVARNIFGPKSGRLSVGVAVGVSDHETAGRIGAQLTF